MQITVNEPAKSVPVIAQADVCVVGGSCTGVFAAVRAARLGLDVVIVEAHNCFGGVATNAMVNIWHSLYNLDEKQQIIAGLTEETITRLQSRNAVDVKRPPNWLEHYILNTEELKIELDEMVTRHCIKPYLHTLFVAPYVNPESGALEGVIVENKDGRGVILAKRFIDASGDGDLAARLQLETYYAPHLQPGTTCAKISNLHEVENFAQLYEEHRSEYNLPETFIWSSRVPGQPNVHMLAASRVSLNMSNAQQLTEAEIEGRRQVRAMLDLIKRKYPDANTTLLQLSSRIGVRETRHVRCLYRIPGQELLSDMRYPDAIANGTYESDIHHTDKSGITFRYLWGLEQLARPGKPAIETRWRPPLDPEPTYYQIPYRSMVPLNSPYPNLIVAGRMLDADEMAHGAIRVMVNMNQVGEAAGVAAYLSLHHNQAYADVDAQTLRKTLAAGGSAVVG